MILKRKQNLLIGLVIFQVFTIHASLGTFQGDLETQHKVKKALPPLPSVENKLYQEKEKIERKITDYRKKKHLPSIPPKNGAKKRKPLADTLATKKYSKNDFITKKDLKNFFEEQEWIAEHQEKQYILLEEKFEAQFSMMQEILALLEEQTSIPYKIQEEFNIQDAHSDHKSLNGAPKGYLAKFKNILTYLCCRKNDHDLSVDDEALHQYTNIPIYREETCMDDCVRIDACFSCNERVIKYAIGGAIVCTTAYGVYLIYPYAQTAGMVISFGVNIFTKIADALGMSIEQLANGLEQTIENVTVTTTKFSRDNNIDFTSQAALNEAFTFAHNTFGNVSSVLIDTFLNIDNFGNTLNDISSHFLKVDGTLQTVSNFVYDICFNIGPCKCAAICECVFPTYNCR